MRELDAKVAKRVFGWRVWYSEFHDAWYCNDPSTSASGCHVHPYSSSWEYAWSIIPKMRDELIFSKRQRFFEELARTVKEKVGFQVAWPDVLLFLGPEDICQAAVKQFGEVGSED